MTVDLSMVRANSLSVLAKSARSTPAAVFTVLPDATKLIFRGRPAAIQSMGQAFGVALPVESCRFASSGDRSAFWLGPDEWMLQAPADSEATLLADLEAQMTRQSYSLVDVSHRSDSFAVSGRRSDYLLNHGCPLELSLDAFPVGMCTRTVFAKAPILLSRPNPETFHLDVWRSFAPYVWELLDEAHSEFA